MPTTIVVDVRFESAHHLPHVPPSHKCARVHGHSYVCEIHVTGPVHPHQGWVLDYADIRAAFEPLRETLDHRDLNTVEGLENPTSEMISKWIWDRLKPRLPELSQLVLHETAHARCIYSA